MTLLYFDGLDNAEFYQKPEWNTDWTFNDSVGRDSSTNGAGGLAGSTLTTRYKTLTLPSTAATCIVGFGMKLNAAQMTSFPVRENFTVAFMVGGVVQCYVAVNASGFLEVRRGSTVPGTVLATSSAHAPITADTWNHLQVKYVAHASAGICEVKLNGATLINLTGANTAATAGPVNMLRHASHQSCLITLDDYWVCDGVDATATQNRPNNDFLGDLKVVTLVPDGAGDATFWSASTGSNYAALDENPPSATDYVFAPAEPSGVRDLYTTSDLPGPATEVYGMRSGIIATKTDVGWAAIRTAVKQDGVVDVSGNLFTPALGAYTAFWDELLTNRVSDDTGLTVADINSMQIGMETV